MKENETLQRKLQSQEEDFRSQNQSLLEELSKVRIPQNTIMMNSFPTYGLTNQYQNDLF